MYFPLAFVALIIDRLVGWPDWLGKAFGHPVIWQGKLIEIMEKRFNQSGFSGKARRLSGLFMLVVLVAATLVISMLIVWALALFPYGWLVEALFASVFLAHRALSQAVKKVADALDISLDGARAAVSHIVGRDTGKLNEEEVVRAAIESLAENSSDGIIAPLFWLALFGLPGIAVYKAINTADSMVGHKNSRFADFGRASARLDDLVNWIPARLSALLYALASFFLPKASPMKSFYVALRDAPNHVSPNAGWPEASLAGALDFSLGGKRAYGGKMLDLAPMGNGKRELEADDIRRAVKLFAAMTLVAMIIVAVLALIQLRQFAL